MGRCGKASGRLLPISRIKRIQRAWSSVFALSIWVCLIVNGAVTWPTSGAEKGCSNSCLVYWIAFSLYTLVFFGAVFCMCCYQKVFLSMPDHIQQNFVCALFTGLTVLMLMISVIAWAASADDDFMMLWWIGAAYLPYLFSMLFCEPATFLMRADPSLKDIQAIVQQLKQAAPQVEFKARCYHIVDQDDGEGGTFKHQEVTHEAKESVPVCVWQTIGEAPAPKDGILLHTVTFQITLDLSGFDGDFSAFKDEHGKKDTENDVAIHWGFPSFTPGTAKNRGTLTVTTTRVCQSLLGAKLVYFGTMPFLLGLPVRVWWLPPKLQTSTVKFKVNVDKSEQDAAGISPEVAAKSAGIVKVDADEVYVSTPMVFLVYTLIWMIMVFACTFMTYENQLGYLMAMFALPYANALMMVFARFRTQLDARFWNNMLCGFAVVSCVLSIVLTGHSLWISVQSSKEESVSILDMNYKQGWGTQNGIYFFKDGWVDVDGHTKAEVDNGCCRRLVADEQELPETYRGDDVTSLPQRVQRSPSKKLARSAWEHAVPWIDRPAAGRFAALASYPRSGSSLLRGLVENMTNTLTGSDTNGYPKSCFPAEGYIVGSLVRTHFPRKDQQGQVLWDAERAVVLVRSPLPAILSLYHRKHTGQHNMSLSHVNVTDLLEFTKAEIFEWSRFYKFWLEAPLPKLLIHYEDLLESEPQGEALQSLAKFLGTPSSSVLKAISEIHDSFDTGRLLRTLRPRDDPSPTPASRELSEKELLHHMRSVCQDTHVRELLLPLFRALGYNDVGQRSNTGHSKHVFAHGDRHAGVVIGQVDESKNNLASSNQNSNVFAALAFAASASSSARTWPAVAPTAVLLPLLLQSQYVQAYGGSGGECSCERYWYYVAPVYESYAANQSGGKPLAYAIAAERGALPEVSYCSKNGGLCGFLVGDGDKEPAIGPQIVRPYVRNARSTLNTLNPPPAADIPLIWSTDPENGDTTQESFNLMMAGWICFAANSPLVMGVVWLFASRSTKVVPV